jgi:hypothetical protein
MESDYTRKQIPIDGRFGPIYVLENLSSANATCRKMKLLVSSPGTITDLQDKAEREAAVSRNTPSPPQAKFSRIVQLQSLTVRSAH